jgi:hypothetical protein
MQLIDEKVPAGTIRVSRCLYCNSTSYGKGCRYAPKGVHFHPSDAKKCSYCGSTNYGRGCKLNPFGDIHLHGIDYNMMFKEKVDKTLKKQFLLKELTKKITEFNAYKLGIIDINGNKIKEPKTLFEQAAYSPAIKLLLKVKKFLGAKTELINTTSLLENKNKIDYSANNLKTVLEYEEKIQDIFAQLHEVTDNALKAGLTIEEVEAML